MYTEDERKVIMDVGAMSHRAVEMARGMIRPGVRLIEVAERVEAYVREGGFGLAFPLNLSVNSEAAHYTPSMGDDRTFGETDVVKVDFGAARDGFLGDCAASVDLSGTRTNLVDGVEEALSNAISMVREGAAVREIGREIAKAIENRGGRPVRNLGGHGVERHNLHAEPFIPNYDDGSGETLKEGEVVAIEPFATDGRGVVTDGETCEIFQYSGEAAVRNPAARRILAEIAEKYGSEPFAARWLAGAAPSRFSLYAAIQELVRAGALETHPTLVEIGGGAVAQAEASVLVERGGCRVLTR